VALPWCDLLISRIGCAIGYAFSQASLGVERMCFTRSLMLIEHAYLGLSLQIQHARALLQILRCYNDLLRIMNID